MRAATWIYGLVLAATAVAGAVALGRLCGPGGPGGQGAQARGQRCVAACTRGWAEGVTPPPLCGPSSRPPDTDRPDELPWLCAARCGLTP